MGAPLVFQEFTESYAPFYDIDFLEFSFSIPIEKKWKYNIYDKWVIEKYPNAAKYAHNGRKITKNKSKNYNLFGKTFTLSELREKIIRMAKMKLMAVSSNMETPYHMNPFDYWYKTNYELRNYMDNYHKKTIVLIEDPKLKHDVAEMYNKGNTMEKTQVLTLLSILQNYYYNTDWLKS